MLPRRRRRFSLVYFFIHRMQVCAELMCEACSVYLIRLDYVDG